MTSKPGIIRNHLRMVNGTTATRRLLAVQKTLAASPPTPSSNAYHTQSTSVETDDTAEVVIKQHPSGLSKIHLNRPTKLNAISFNMCDLISQGVLAWERSEKSKAILITAAGNKAFSAGGDIRILVDMEQSGRHEECIALFQKHPRLNHAVGSINKPIIAFMHGITMGGGVGLTINASFRIATETTVHAMPETMIGHHPDASASFWMPRLDGFLGLYLMLTGRRLRGADVYYSGIATHYVHSSNLKKLENALEELANESNGILEQDAINAVIVKYSVDLEQEKAPFSLGGGIYQAINRCFQYDTMEEIMTALKEEKYAVKWAKETHDLLCQMSPTSLKLTLQLYHTGSQLSFVECMKLEYQLTTKTLASKEFSEGTSAALITKKAPNWNPPTLEQIDAKEIKRYFFDTPICNPLITLCEGGNHTEYLPTRFILPRCSEILDVSKTMNRDDTINYFLKKHNGKSGVKIKVISIIDK